MNNCIFANKCTRQICDNSCPTFIESDYLLSRNNISIQSDVFRADMNQIMSCNDFFDRHTSGLVTVLTKSSISASQLLAYVAICRNWKGNRLHCSVYHLKLSSYLDAMQLSWSTKTAPEEFEYQDIWIRTSKILIVSGLDFINFKDFQAQTLLNMIHERTSNRLLTVVVSPPTSLLIGDRAKSAFFTRLTSVLSESSDTEVHI